MKKTVLVAGLMMLVAGAALAADPKGPSIEWRHSWAEACEEAKVRNVPVFVTFHKDG
jgi:hypothetical protein